MWLCEQVNIQREVCTMGFDEYMHLTLGDTGEMYSLKKVKKTTV